MGLPRAHTVLELYVPEGGQGMPDLIGRVPQITPKQSKPIPTNAGKAKIGRQCWGARQSPGGSQRREPVIQGNRTG